MAKRLGYAIVFTVFGVGGLLAACGDDPSTSDDVTGGAAGEPSNAAGTKSAGSASGGNAGKTGASEAGAAGEATTPSDGGEPSVGGAATGSGGASEGGATGSTGGSGEAGAAGAAAELTYACNSTTISHKMCSTLAAADCTEEIICADCVGERNSDREAFGACAACGAQYDEFMNCGIDAFESGNLSSVVECYDGYADLNDNCAEYFNQTLACTTYVVDHDCPETWPLE